MGEKRSMNWKEEKNACDIQVSKLKDMALFK
jgi:hypothetical protein